nr:MAG TPA: hypothetical protein [Caudoviricetes sp.]
MYHNYTQLSTIRDIFIHQTRTIFIYSCKKGVRRYGRYRK